MSHLFLFCLHIKRIIICELDLDGHSLYDFQPEITQTFDFRRIICQKSQLRRTQVSQNLCSYVIFPLVFFKSESQICLYRIHSLVLQSIGLQFVDQTNAPAFLSQIEQNSPAFRFDLSHGRGKLISAVAP